MENEMNIGLDEEKMPKKKSNFLLIGIIAGVILVLLIAMAVLNSPKILAGRLINNTDDAIKDFFEVKNAETPLFMTESHQSETKLTMDGTEFGFEGDIELTLMSGYLNSNGDLLGEMELGLGDMDAITAGLYLKDSELAFISSILTNKYFIDLEAEDELGKDTALEDRFSYFGSKEEQEKLEELNKRAKEKLEEYKKFAFKVMPSKTITKTKENIELFGEDQKVTCVEIVMDEDQFKEWAEVVLEKMGEDEELQDLAEEYLDFINEKYNLEDIEDEDIDIEEESEDTIDDLDDLEAEIEIRIFYKGSKPLAYEIIYDDGYTEIEGIIQMYTSGSKKEFLIDFDVDGEEIYVNSQQYDENNAFIEYELGGIKCEVTAEEIKNGVTEISGTFESDYGMEGEISGEIIESKNSIESEISYEYSDGYSIYEINFEGSVLTDGSEETTEFAWEVIVDDEEMMNMNLELVKEEVKKNKEYTTEGELVIESPEDGIEFTIDIENTTIYGSEAEVKLPSWSKDDINAKISDQEELEELLSMLEDDFTTGMSDFYSMFYYGGLY